MKKLLRNFAILTIFACGLFTGCNNDASIDLNVTVSTDTPSLDEPKNLGYGVLLTWGITQDANYFRVTRQEKDGEEKIIGYVGFEEDEMEGNRFFDQMGFYNELKEGVEYTYRVYNLGDKPYYNYEGANYNHNHEYYNDDGSDRDSTWYEYDNYSMSKGSFYYGDNCVVKTSYAEKKITLAAGSLKKQGDKLEAVNKDNVKTSFKNGNLEIYFLNDENRSWSRYIVVRDAETGKKLSSRSYGDFSNISAQKVNVEIKNVDSDGYYADSDVVTIEDIENIKVEENVSINDFTATRNGKTVVLQWITYKKVEPSEFKVLRTKVDYSNDYAKPEVLKITPTYEETYYGVYYWTAFDETAEVGTRYKYEVITTDFNSDPDYVSGSSLDPYITLDVSVNGYYSSISNETDEIILSFYNDDKNVTYKGYWTTVDNKGNESARTEFAFTKDNDEHYRKTFKASDFANLKKSVSVNFYVKSYCGDKWSGYEKKETVSVSPSITTYTSLSDIQVNQPYDYQTGHSKEITIDFYGCNLENAIEATYFKNNGGEIKSLTLTKVSTSQYTVKLTDLDAGNYYTICATVPEGNAYSLSSSSDTKQFYVEWYY